MTIVKEGSFRRLVRNMRKCPVKNRLCLEHGFYHGKEAEELRSGIERLLKHGPRKSWTDSLRRLLDRVDARDSLAFREAESTRQRDDRIAEEGPDDDS